MDKKLKIVTIGGGSSYTPELIEGFIKRYDELPVGEIVLVDIEAGKEKLEIIGNLARRMIAKAGLPIKIVTTLDRIEALKGADFVTTQFRVGGLDAREKDELIPLKYGVVGQETNGPGGMFKGLRTIPVILEICKEVKQYCPDAWVISFTNPAGMNTQAVLEYSGHKKFIGLCNGPLSIKKQIAGLLKADMERIYIEIVGLNHLIFAKKVYLDGDDVTKEVMRLKLKSNQETALKNIEDISWDNDFMLSLGMIPIDYLRYYFQTSEILKQQLTAADAQGSRAQVVKKVEKELFELYKNPELDIKPKQLEQRGGAYYSDAACSLICSIYTDKRDIQTVNCQNNGAILDLDPMDAVEINCVITKQGPIPLTTGRLPVPVNGIVQQIKTFEKLTVRAAVTGDYHTALLAMTCNPLVPSDITAKRILDEMLEAHKQYLPQFKKEDFPTN